MKSICERKEGRFSLKRNKPKCMWVSNISLLTVYWVSRDNSSLSVSGVRIENSILTEEISISLLIYKI